MTESVGRMGMYLVSTSHTHDVPSAVKRGEGHGPVVEKTSTSAHRGWTTFSSTSLLLGDGR